MKKYLLFAAVGLSLMYGCKDEEVEPEVDPITGTWFLNEGEFLNSGYEGITFGPLFYNSISQRIIINEDNTFQYREERLDALIYYFSGDWTLEGDSALVLDYDGGGTEEYVLQHDNLLTAQFNTELPDPEDSTSSVIVATELRYLKEL